MTDPAPLDDCVDVVVEDSRWQPVLPTLAPRAIASALSGAGLTGTGWEVVVLGCDDARIAALNADHRGKPAPTNVLSWPSAVRDPELPPEGGELGDIAIAFETCDREARDQGKPFEAHVTHLLVHGALHLLGHDHMDDAEAARMEALEIRILAELGFPDPYADATVTS